MIAGHKKIIEDLKSLSKSARLSHSYIFYGPSMVGKRTTARAFAKFLEKGEFAAVEDNEVLQDAKLIDLAFAKSLDANVKDSIGIDAVREIRNFLWQKPNASARRTLIIDEAELLTTEAQNALLKLTEEPPASSLLIIITSDIESMLPTILSRMQKVYFGVVPEAEIAAWLGKKNDSKTTKQALGKPGLAWRLTNDEAFAESLELAEKFLKTPATTRKDFIKKIIEPDDFNLRTFLDAVIIVLSAEKPSKMRSALWHRTLALQENAMNFGLNPRLQLETLLM
jgi:DNA polymerase III subunit delta'